MYADQASGIGADEVYFRWGGRDGASQEPEKWVDALKRWTQEGDEKESKPPGTREPPPEKDAEKRDYNSAWSDKWLMRPEVRRPPVVWIASWGDSCRQQTLESIYILWKTSKNPVWRERGWRIFQSIEKWAKTPYGYASLSWVNRGESEGGPVQMDDMPRYVLDFISLRCRCRRRPSFLLVPSLVWCLGYVGFGMGSKGRAIGLFGFHACMEELPFLPVQATMATGGLLESLSVTLCQIGFEYLNANPGASSPCSIQGKIESVVLPRFKTSFGCVLNCMSVLSPGFIARTLLFSTMIFFLCLSCDSLRRSLSLAHEGIATRRSFGRNQNPPLLLPL